jgi:hypothetical protein
MHKTDRIRTIRIHQIAGFYMPEAGYVKEKVLKTLFSEEFFQDIYRHHM